MGASKTIDRIIDSFPDSQQQQIRIQLSSVLQAVVTQQLIPSRDSMIPAFEIMMNTHAIANLIREAKAAQIYSTMQTNSGFGMQTLEMALRDLYVKKKITLEDALSRSSRPEEFKRGLQNS
jgi:twitching motility protein PilT